MNDKCHSEPFGFAQGRLREESLSCPAEEGCFAALSMTRIHAQTTFLLSSWHLRKHTLKNVAQPPSAVSEGKAQPGAAVPHLKSVAYISI